MQKTWKSLAGMMMLGAIVAGGMTSCKDDDDDNENNGWTAQDVAINAAGILDNYVDNVVFKTYNSLANSAETLMDDVEKLSESKTQVNLQKVCDEWKRARKYWEWSEAFLFGAAADYSIDPHIDTWPFDQTAFNQMMANFSKSEKAAKDSAIVIESVVTSQNLTGFHAMEYVIFANGQARNVEEITDDELFFLQAVSEDLFLSSCRLEASWRAENKIAKSHLEILEDGEYYDSEKNEFGLSNYGEEFKNAGKAGSRYKSPTIALVQILEGANDVIGEVRDAKIGSAVEGTNTEYIESPFSYNSIQDFYDNIISCVHAIYGTMEITDGAQIDKAASVAKSLNAYGMLTHTEAMKDVNTALVSALAKIAAMKAPFVLNYTDESARAAMEGLDPLEEAIDKMIEKLRE